MKHNLIGKLFYNLTILKKDTNPKYVICLCSCGNTKSIRLDHVKSGNTKSCGCLNNIHRGPEKELYMIYKKSAEQRNLDFQISFDFFKEIIKKDCFYCGVNSSQYFTTARKRENGKFRPFKGDIYYNGIDRKNNNLGYIQNNCIACCKKCNYLKSNDTFDEFINHVLKIAKNIQTGMVQ